MKSVSDKLEMNRYITEWIALFLNTVSGLEIEPKTFDTLAPGCHVITEVLACSADWNENLGIKAYCV